MRTLVLMLALLMPSSVVAQVHFIGPRPTPEERAWAEDARVRISMVAAWYQLRAGDMGDFRPAKHITVCLVRSPDQLVKVKRSWGPNWHIDGPRCKIPWRSVIWKRIDGYVLEPNRDTGYAGLFDGKTVFICTFLDSDGSAEWELLIHEMLHTVKDRRGAYLLDGPVLSEMEWQAEQTPLHLKYEGPWYTK